MALSSMTGFARSHGASGPYAFEWELKSVNAKGFDLRMRLPPGWDELEAAGQEARRRSAVARHRLRQPERQARQCRLDRPDQRGGADLDRQGGPRALGQDRRGGAEHRRTAGDQGRHRSRRARSRRGGGQGRQGCGRCGVRTGADQPRRDAAARGRGAWADPVAANGRDRNAGQEGRGGARPQARGDQGAARRADRRAAGYVRPFRSPTG